MPRQFPYTRRCTFRTLVPYNRYNILGLRFTSVRGDDRSTEANQSIPYSMLFHTRRDAPAAQRAPRVAHNGGSSGGQVQRVYVNRSKLRVLIEEPTRVHIRNSAPKMSGVCSAPKNARYLCKGIMVPKWEHSIVPSGYPV